MNIEMNFFDSHCHFDFAAFDEDRDAVWRECCAQGMIGMIVPGVSPAQWHTSAKIMQSYDAMYGAAGLHPWWVEQEIEAQDLDNYLQGLKEQLRVQLNAPNCIAIGECGMDAFIPLAMDVQQRVFEAHVQVAQESKKPLIIHSRKAHNEIMQTLKHYELPAGGVVHAFSGSAELAGQYWALGFRIGIGGTITYERANKTRNTVKQVPLESILLETDAPDMPLSGKQGQRNSPVNIIAIAQMLADLRSETLEHIATQTTANAQQLFKING
jgi:TatD DNase family protein